MQRDRNRAAELAAVAAADHLCRSREPGLIAREAKSGTGAKMRPPEDVGAW